MTSSIGMFDLTAENVALVTRSTIQVAPTAAITDEAHTSQGVALELIPFKYLPDLTKPVTVKTAGTSRWPRARTTCWYPTASRC